MARGRVFATSGVWLPPEDELWRHCDSGMHWDCLASWQHRPRFVGTYTRARASGEATNPYWVRAYEDACCYIDVEVPDPHTAHVTLFETATHFEVSTAEWDGWLQDAEHAKDLHHLELLALSAALRELRANVPTRERLLAGVDPERLAKKMAWHEAQQRAADDARAYAAELDAMAETAARDGLECPQCKRASKDYKRGTKGRDMPYLACRRCGFRFGPRGPVLK